MNRRELLAALPAACSVAVVGANRNDTASFKDHNLGIEECLAVLEFAIEQGEADIKDKPSSAGYRETAFFCIRERLRRLRDAIGTDAGKPIALVVHSDKRFRDDAVCNIRSVVADAVNGSELAGLPVLVFGDGIKFDVVRA